MSVRTVPSYVADVLGRFPGIRQTVDGWVAPCPCPTHGHDGTDSRPSLRLTVGREGRILVHCRVGCKFEDVLHAVRLAPSMLFPSAFDGPPAVSLAYEEQDQTPDDLRLLADEVYRFMIGCLSLEAEHQKDLLRRGLSRAEIVQRGYVSLRAVDIPRLLRSLQDEFDARILHVPGFFQKDDLLCMQDVATGLVVPVRDADNRLAALKIRRNGEPKYVYLSSSAVGGRGPGSPCHCPVPGLGVDRTRVRVTEGELKADVATARSGLYTVGIAGVNNWWRVFDTLQTLGAKEVLVSFDWRDVRLKKPVAEQTLGFVRALQEKGYRVGVECWEETFKGIDDVLAEDMETIEVWEGVETLLSSQPALTSAQREEGWEPAPFPVDVFPPPLREFVDEVASTLPCPPDFVAVPMLVISGTMFGNTRRIRMQRGWDEPANLYACIIAPPGSMKTPAIKEVSRPCIQIQTELLDRFAQEETAFAQRLTVWDVRKRVYKKLLDRFLLNNPSASETDPEAPQMPEDKPPPPLQEHLYVDDVTLESLAGNLQSSPRGVVRITDEFVQFLRNMNVYRGGQGGDRQQFLSLWSCAPIKVDRKSAKGGRSIFVERPFFSILGGIQPDLLGSLEEEQGREDGFIHRVLFSMPTSNAVPPWTRRDMNQARLDAWARVVRALRCYDFDAEKRPLCLGITPEAADAFADWYERHCRETQAPGFPSLYEGPWSKFKAYTVRIALILHLLRQACRDCGLTEENVSAESVEWVDFDRAIAVVEYFKQHLRGVFDRFAFDKDGRKIRDFLRWAKEEKNGRVYVREVWGQHSRWFKSRRSAQTFLDKVCDRGFGHIGTDKSPSGKSRHFFQLSSVEE